MRGQPVQGEAGIEPALLAGGLVGLLQAVGQADQAAEVAIALPCRRQQREVVARAGQGGLGQGQLHAGDGANAILLALPGEDHGPEEVVVVGDRERRVPEPDRPGDQLLRVRGPVQQRVVGMEVELDVRNRRTRLAPPPCPPPRGGRVIT